MPGRVDDTEAILHFVADELGSDTYVNPVGSSSPPGAAVAPLLNWHRFSKETSRRA
jgi:hypothetical protein